MEKALLQQPFALPGPKSGKTAPPVKTTAPAKIGTKTQKPAPITAPTNTATNENAPINGTKPATTAAKKMELKRKSVDTEETSPTKKQNRHGAGVSANNGL